MISKSILHIYDIFAVRRSNPVCCEWSCYESVRSRRQRQSGSVRRTADQMLNMFSTWWKLFFSSFVAIHLEFFFGFLVFVSIATYFPTSVGEADRDLERLWASNSWSNADDRNWCELYALVEFSSFVLIHLEPFFWLFSVHFYCIISIFQRGTFQAHIYYLSQNQKANCFAYFFNKMLTIRATRSPWNRSEFICVCSAQVFR